MFYKLYNEAGEYRDCESKESRNLLEANEAVTPEGINVGWTEFASLSDCMVAWNLESVPDIENNILE